MDFLKPLVVVVLLSGILASYSGRSDWRSASRGSAGRGVMGIKRDIPDRYWYGAKPRLLKQHQGAGAESLIDVVDAAAHLYPWKKAYRAFPGPNSNTFTAWIAQQVPELELELPFSAIGSGYLDQHK
jgi:hypothetical protein